ncbi:hypothetical protein JOL79_09485 [Microbispora sp. RL4-1S]|uniref:HTTM domain-containing protein n=1 Tax=Microbispora oryzae TaxID=2806554 RepID=A0A941APU1_9ACTN|nr:hypothetical protein [Microbispora oryzae]MBP2704039.1 hypothetical protein [Microbispora oryzae]
MGGALTRWWFAPADPRRVTVLRRIVYLFLPLDMLLFTGSVLGHTQTASAYQPVLLARLLHLPGAGPVLVPALFAVVVVAALTAAAGRLPRAAGYTVAAGYLYWALLAMSYGKVDHDHLALITALWVLPTVTPGGGRQAAGWAVRCVQVAVVATYFLSAYAKIRWGGWEWPNGATFAWAVSRRGTFLGVFFAGVPNLLWFAQWGILLAETASPVLFLLRGRWLYAGVAFFLGFHLITWATITIHFLPHVICLTAFLPLERLGRRGPGPAAARQFSESALPL